MITTFNEFFYASQSRAEQPTEADYEYKKNRYGDMSPIVFRGVPRMNSNGVVDPKKHDRISMGNKNYYTLWIDNHPAWSEFPKRSKSLICSTSYTTAHSYAKNTNGVPFEVWPLEDDAIFGVCPEHDIWSAMTHKITKDGKMVLLSEGRWFDSGLDDVTNIGGHSVLNADWNTDADGLQYKAMNLYDLVLMLERYSISDRSYDEMVRDLKDKNLYVFVERFITPYGFEHLTFEELAKYVKTGKHGDHREVWTESRCLLTS